MAQDDFAEIWVGWIEMPSAHHMPDVLPILLARIARGAAGGMELQRDQVFDPRDRGRA